MARPLRFIVGAGALGRSLRAWFKHEPFDGFVDDDATRADVVGSVAWLAARLEPAQVVLAIGSAAAAQEVHARLSANAALSFPALVHPSAIVSVDAVPEGVIVCPFAMVGVDASLGPFVLLNAGAAVSHDCTVGAWTRVHGGARLLGHVRVGDRVFIGAAAGLLFCVVITLSGAVRSQCDAA